MPFHPITPTRKSRPRKIGPPTKARLQEPRDHGLVASVSTHSDFRKTRYDFPILDQEVNGHPLVYLDNAASSQKPEQVVSAICDYYRHHHSNVHRGLHALSGRATDMFEGARARAARFLNAAHAEEIIFTRGTTESLNLCASSICRAFTKPGDRILLTEMEHHSNLVPWQLAAQQYQLELRFVPIDPSTGTLDLENLEDLLSDRTAIFSFTHVSNSLATIAPAETLCRMARACGVISIIDAAQSAGHLPVDVQALDCDFLAFSGHKVCGPTGIGILYGRKELLEKLPPYHGGGEMINRVRFQDSDFKPPPHRFEAGTPNIAGTVGLHAALDYLDQLGRQAIFEHDRELASRAMRELIAMKEIDIYGPPLDENGLSDRGGLVSFNLRDVHAHDVVTFADSRGIALRGGHHCTQPLMRRLGVTGTARASFYFYNTEEEVDRFVNMLKEARTYFHP